MAQQMVLLALPHVAQDTSFTYNLTLHYNYHKAKDTTTLIINRFSLMFSTLNHLTQPNIFYTSERCLYQKKMVQILLSMSWNDITRNFVILVTDSSVQIQKCQCIQCIELKLSTKQPLSIT